MAKNPDVPPFKRFEKRAGVSMPSFKGINYENSPADLPDEQLFYIQNARLLGTSVRSRYGQNKVFNSALGFKVVGLYDTKTYDGPLGSTIPVPATHGSDYGGGGGGGGGETQISGFVGSDAGRAWVYSPDIINGYSNLLPGDFSPTIPFYSGTSGTVCFPRIGLAPVICVRTNTIKGRRFYSIDSLARVNVTGRPKLYVTALTPELVISGGTAYEFVSGTLYGVLVQNPSAIHRFYVSSSGGAWTEEVALDEPYRFALRAYADTFGYYLVTVIPGVPHDSYNHDIYVRGGGGAWQVKHNFVTAQFPPYPGEAVLSADFHGISGYDALLFKEVGYWYGPGLMALKMQRWTGTTAAFSEGPEYVPPFPVSMTSDTFSLVGMAIDGAGERYANFSQSKSGGGYTLLNFVWNADPVDQNQQGYFPSPNGGPYSVVLSGLGGLYNGGYISWYGPNPPSGGGGGMLRVWTGSSWNVVVTGLGAPIFVTSYCYRS